MIILQNYTYRLNLSHLELRGNEGNEFPYFSYFSPKLANFKVKISDFQFWQYQTSIFGLRAKYDLEGCDLGPKLKITKRNLMPQFGLFHRTTLLNTSCCRIRRNSSLFNFSSCSFSTAAFIRIMSRSLSRFCFFASSSLRISACRRESCNA